MHNIESRIDPKSIAVVGASNRPGTVGLAAFKNLLQAGCKGIFYPVRPKAKSVQAVKADPSFLDIPDEVDVALVIAGADRVPSFPLNPIQYFPSVIPGFVNN